MANICILLLAGVASLAAGYTLPDLTPGPYCGITGECCRNRQDSCAHRILDTLCYCDETCDLNRPHHDCCPDYIPVCRNGSLPLPPQTITEPRRYRGKRFLSNGQSNSVVNSFNNNFVNSKGNSVVNSNNNILENANGNGVIHSNGNIIRNGNGNSIVNGKDNRIENTNGITLVNRNGAVIVNGIEKSNGISK